MSVVPPDYVNPDYVRILVEEAMKSPCVKSKRAALLVSPDFEGLIGRSNRPAVGDCDGSEECRRDCGRICLHAEQRALVDAGWYANGSEVYHLKVVDGEGVPSDKPSCVECSKLMLLAGVAGVWLLVGDPPEWRRWTAKAFHFETLANLGLHEGSRPTRAATRGGRP